MARKKAKRMRPKFTGYPAQRYLYYHIEHTSTSAGSEDFHYIDLARDLSAVNCRLYRQGMIYNVASFTIQDSDDDTEMRICTIPNVWPAHSAYKLARRAWNKQIRDTMGGDKLRGAWDDFRVHFNEDHVTDGDVPLTIDTEGDSSNLYGETIASMLSTSPQGTDACLAMLGNGNASFNGNLHANYGGLACDGIIGVVHEWQKMQTIIQETPNATTTFESSAFAPMNLFPETDSYDDDITDRVESYHDLPPYSVSPGSYLYESGKDGYIAREVHIGTGQNSVMIPGCEVMLGLLQIETVNDADANNTMGLLIELAPGNYKGIDALEI